jgi:deoxyxylulose-5-phosphate synthase
MPRERQQLLECTTDRALSAGMAYEVTNNAGASRSRWADCRCDSGNAKRYWTRLIWQRFSHRTFDVEIAEQHAVTFAAGMA